MIRAIDEFLSIPTQRMNRPGQAFGGGDDDFRVARAGADFRIAIRRGRGGQSAKAQCKQEGKFQVLSFQFSAPHNPMRAPARNADRFVRKFP